MAAGACRRVEGTRHQEALPALLQRPPGGDECAASTTGFDHDRGVREATDETVPAREGASSWARIGQQLGHDSASGTDDRVGETLVGARKELGVTASKNGHRRPVLRDHGGVRGSVNSDRKPRHHHGAGSRQGRADPARDQPTFVRRPTRTHDGHRMVGGHRLQCALHVQDRRWQVDEAQSRRIRRLFQRHHREAEVADAFDGSAPLPDPVADPRSEIGTDARWPRRHRGAVFTRGPSRLVALIGQGRPEEFRPGRRGCRHQSCGRRTEGREQSRERDWSQPRYGQQRDPRIPLGGARRLWRGPRFCGSSVCGRGRLNRRRLPFGDPTRRNRSKHLHT